MSHIQRYPRNETGRDLVVGDIHGHFSNLLNVLLAIEFDGEKDRLFSVGDLVDRGPESHHAVRWLQQPWFHAVMGNHEDTAIRYEKGNPVDPGIYRANGGGWFMELRPDQQKLYADEFRKLPIAMEVETADGIVGIVHADCPFLTWEQMCQALEAPSRPSLAGRVADRCMWSRERVELRSRECVEGVRAVVVGHTPMDEPLILGNVYHIDTAGWHPEGRFTLLDLATLRPIPIDDRPLQWTEQI